MQVPVLTCKKKVGKCFSLGTKYEVQAYMPQAEEAQVVLVVDDNNGSHYMGLDWLSEHFDLEGDLELVLEEWQ